MVSPIVDFHVLSIEKEHSWWDVADIKIVGVNRGFIHIDYVDRGHVTQVMCRFWQLQKNTISD